MAKTKKGLEYWCEPENLEKIEKWGEKLSKNDEGFSIGKIAKKMGVSRSTLYNWSNKNEDILDALTRARTYSVDSVENSLYKKCHGYNAKVKKIIKLKKMDYDDNGKLIRAYEEPVEVEEEVHVQADTTAIKFYLTNMMPSKWKATVEIAAAENDNNSGVIELPAVEKALPPAEGE